MAEHERPEVATKTVVKIPDISDLSPVQAEAVIAKFADEFPAEVMLGIAAETVNRTVTLLAAIADRLQRRQQDLNDLLSIVKSATEMTRKIERLSTRLLAEEHRNVK